MKHMRYLKYMLVHKYWVAVLLWKAGYYVQALTHDWSKFLPGEWWPYTRYFYSDGDHEPGMQAAWQAHQRRNPHHWQHWAVLQDSGGFYPLSMPVRYIVEMIADWMSAGATIKGGRPSVKETINWYKRNRQHMVLSMGTRSVIEGLFFFRERDFSPGVRDYMVKEAQEFNRMFSVAHRAFLRLVSV